MLLNDYLDEYLISLVVEKGLSKSTIESYKNDLKQFLTFLGDKSTKDDLLPEKVNNFLEKLHSEDLKASSIVRKLSSIKNFLVYLSLHAELAFDFSSLESHKKGKYLPYVISKEKMRQMLDSLPLETNKDIRNKAMIELMYACGLRVSELLSLTLNEVSLEKSQLKVKGKGAKERVIPIDEVAKNYLIKYLDEVRSNSKYQKEKQIFISDRGKMISRQEFYLIIKKSFERIGIINKVSPHTIRHCFASHLLENGCSLSTVKALLGHADIKTTEIYTHVETKHLLSEYDKMMK